MLPGGQHSGTLIAKNMMRYVLALAALAALASTTEAACASTAGEPLLETPTVAFE